MVLVRECLLDAAQVWLVSNVPLGAFLGNGLNSNSMIMLMRAATDGPIRAVAEAAGARHLERSTCQACLTVALSGLGGNELFGGYPNTFVQEFQVYIGLRLAQAAIDLLPNHEQQARVADAFLPGTAWDVCTGEMHQLVTPDVWNEAAQAFDPVEHRDHE